MPTDKYRQLATEVDALPDEGLHHVLGCEVTLDEGDTTRSIQAKLAYAPQTITPEAAAAMEASRIAFRKGTIDDKAALLELCDVVTPFDDLANYWRFEDGADPWVDAVGGNDLNHLAPFPVANSVPGKNNLAAEMVIGSVSILRSDAAFDWSGPWSLSFWHKPPAGVARIFIDDESATIYNGWGATANRFDLRINSAPTVSGTVVAVAGVFHHVAYVSDGATFLQYVNGVLDITVLDAPTNVAGKMRIYNGIFDEAARFAAAIPPEQVAALYAAGAGAFY